MRLKILYASCAVLLLTALWLMMKPTTEMASSSSVVLQSHEYYFEIRGENVHTEPQIIRAMVGDTLKFSIESDQKDELHLHGVDKHLHLRPGETLRFEFAAETAGRFAMELHDSGIHLATIEVYPR
jgi:hypothetical protein